MVKPFIEKINNLKELMPYLGVSNAHKKDEEDFDEQYEMKHNKYPLLLKMTRKYHDELRGGR
jgi:hypothetical protein